MARAAVFGCAGPQLEPDEAAFFREADPWGFILFARNIASPDQVRRLTAALRDAVGRDAPVFVDQEGGRVARLRPPHWYDWPPALEEVPQALRARYRVIGAELRAVGINANCAPLLDVATPATHPILRNRCLGTSPATVAARGRVVVDALRSVGVLPVIKHLPGQGRADMDSHETLPRVRADRAALKEDFTPFAALADQPVGMTAHVVFDALDDTAATVSPTVVRIIRETIGFDGLLLTDDLSMKALTGGFERRARAALEAGCDVILHCNGDREEMAAVAGAVPALAGGRVHRAEAALSGSEPQDIVDLADEFAQYSTIKMRAGAGSAG